MEGPKTLILNRRNGAFGFTLRHFIVYPPDANDPVIAEKLARCGLSNFSQPMDTVFVKKVTHKSEAEYAGLKEGDRLIAVNGIPISLQFQFPDIVATIQNTSKTLIIQIVPKCYDILQTFFSETAHNPETNQRLVPNTKLSTTAIPVSLRTTPSCLRTELCSYPENPIYHLPLKQTDETNIYSNGNEGAIKTTTIPVFQHQQQQKQLKTFVSTPLSQNQEIKDAIMSRLKHQIEQKEEFLKRPNGIPQSSSTGASPSSTLLNPRISTTSTIIQHDHDNHHNNHRSMESEYARSQQRHHSTIHELTEIQNTRSALREQFFTNHNNTQQANNKLSSSFLMHDYAKENHTSDSKESQLKNSRMQIVLERTKQFETGHPSLSPDGIDRTSLYKSELSRMSTKPSTSSVASKCQAIESRLKPKISSKCLSEEMMKEEDDIKYNDDMIRSVSMEPIKECDKTVEKRTLLDKEKERPRPVRENSYLTAVRSSTDAPQSFLRQKSPKKSFNLSVEENDRKTRRSSYLKATTLEDDELNIAQKIDENSEAIKKTSTNNNIKTTENSSSQDEPQIFEGLLNVKIISINGRRTQDRSWRLCNAELKKNFLKLSTVREANKNSQSPDSEGTLDLTNFVVSEGNYSKRKHVFRLSSVQCDSNNESELMLQASNPVEMKDWVTSLRQVTRVKKDYSDQQQQDHSGLDSSNDDVLNSSYPQKSVKKYHFGSRSPSGQSPVFKSRKAPQNLLLPSNSSINRDGSDKETSSPKQKSWKSFVTNQFKKMHPSNDSTSSNESNTCFLSECTPSEEDIHVPLLIAKCTKIVETKGLNIVGIYRIPGNTAAISGLYETIKNHGFNEQTLNDAKWDDVNVVSSLLKLFIRSLTEPILPNNLYQNFIAADKISNEEQRFQELRSLLRKFPPHNYGTLKHLIAHLTKVSSNSSVNLMEPRNLAIVFGPSIIRKCNDSLETVVKDMRHQCQIVESLINNYGYFFENETSFKQKSKSQLTSNEPELPSAEHLLENVSKIESMTKDRDSSRFVANIVQAANRKIRKTTQRRSTTSSCTSDTDSVSNSEAKSTNKYTKSTKNHEMSRSSEDESENKFLKEGSEGLSLSATVTEVLESKIQSLRNSFELGTGDENSTTQDSIDSFERTTSPKVAQNNTLKPLSIGENIPYVDESPERPLIQARSKPMRHCQNSHANSDAKLDKSKADYSSDTDSSTTSNHNHHHDRLRSVIRLEDSVLRKVNRILTNLEHLERKYSLNRSLSLNYKSHKGECCCSSRERNRLTLTKDEKTDKNISKRKQLHDTTNVVNSQNSSNGLTKYRKHHNGNRSIRRRHTVGGEINREEIRIIKR